MSKLSIYETKWTDLVFENKNKEYGAYQLRQENSKTTVTALFLGLLFFASIGSISVIINHFRTQEIIDPQPIIPEVLTVTKIHPQVVKPEDPKPIAPPQQAAATAPVSAQLVHPILVSPDQALPEVATNVNNTVPVDNTSAGTGTVTNVLPSSGGGGESGTAVAPTTVDPLPVGALDKLPEFPGGIAKFYTYVSRNFVTPEMDTERIFKVYVSFVVEKDGSITDIIARNDPGYGIGKEAVRVLKSLKTKWAPGMLDGKAVRTAYNLPITIKTQPE
ncbi:protein TonB [Flavobacterium sp. 270]|uniref:energy transducer TonB n=1 Tax=Flavobacterium sp. 270 TaxID=2512114 RepID=UPI001066614B|nr:energy transducer TonB [Flavobacterium sp. 270]TDW47242.1 protein TonB [Flavobacterium sp. 270]